MNFNDYLYLVKSNRTKDDVKIGGKQNVYMDGRTKASNAVQAYTKISNGLAKQTKK